MRLFYGFLFFVLIGYNLYVKFVYIYIYNKCRCWKLIILIDIYLNIGKGYYVVR